MTKLSNITGSQANGRLPQPPIFGVLGSDEKIGKTGIISLVDIFDEFLFANDRTNNAAIKQENLLKDRDDSGDIRDDDDDGDYDSFGEEGFDETEDGKKRKRTRGMQRNMTEEQKIERR